MNKQWTNKTFVTFPELQESQQFAYMCLSSTYSCGFVNPTVPFCLKIFNSPFLSLLKNLPLFSQKLHRSPWSPVFQVLFFLLLFVLLLFFFSVCIWYLSWFYVRLWWPEYIRAGFRQMPPRGWIMKERKKTHKGNFFSSSSSFFFFFFFFLHSVWGAFAWNFIQCIQVVTKAPNIKSG